MSSERFFAAVIVLTALFVSFSFFAERSAGDDPYFDEGRITLLCPNLPTFLAGNENVAEFRTFPSGEKQDQQEFIVTVPWIGPECLFIVAAFTNVADGSLEDAVEFANYENGLLLHMPAIGGVLALERLGGAISPDSVLEAVVARRYFRDLDSSFSIGVPERFEIGALEVDWLYSREEFLKDEPYQSLRLRAAFQEREPVYELIGRVRGGKYDQWGYFAALLPRL